MPLSPLMTDRESDAVAVPVKFAAVWCVESDGKGLVVLKELKDVSKV